MIYNIRSVYWITKYYPEVCHIIYRSYSIAAACETKAASGYHRAGLDTVRQYTSSNDESFIKNFYKIYKHIPSFNIFLGYRINKTQKFLQEKNQLTNNVIIGIE